MTILVFLIYKISKIYEIHRNSLLQFKYSQLIAILRLGMYILAIYYINSYLECWECYILSYLSKLSLISTLIFILFQFLSSNKAKSEKPTASP